MRADPPLCPLPAWIERALARPAVALAVSALAWGSVTLIWGFLALDLLIEAAPLLWADACGVAR